MLNEADARYWLGLVSSRRLRIRSEDEYLLLRRAVGLTAGFNRGPNRLARNIKSDKAALIVKTLEESGICELRGITRPAISSIERSIKELERDFLSGSRSSRTFAAPNWAYSLIKATLSTEVLEACKVYLETKTPFIYTPIILASSCEKSLIEMTSEEKSNRAFAFHRDIDNVKWLKLFVVLTSCEGGEHYYCMGSHHTGDRDVSDDYEMRVRSCGGFSYPFEAKTKYETHVYTGRFSDDSVLRIYGTQSVRNVSQINGEAWLEDTYGLHKGTPPKKGARLMLSVLIGKLDIRYE